MTFNIYVVICNRVPDNSLSKKHQSRKLNSGSFLFTHVVAYLPVIRSNSIANYCAANLQELAKNNLSLNLAINDLHDV